MTPEITTRLIAWWRGGSAVVRPLDVAIALALTVAGFVTLTAVDSPEEARAPDAFAYVLVLVFTLPLMVRLRWPLHVLGLCMVAIVIAGIRDYPSSAADFMATWLAFFTVVTQLPRSRSIAAAVVIATIVVLSQAVFGDGDVWTSFATTLFLIVAAWFLGDSVRQRRLAMQRLAEQAEELRLTRLELAEQAVNQERLRIARELHDTVAHNMTVVVVQSAVARELVETDPSAAAKAMQEVEDAGRRGLADMRDILGLLREAAGPQHPTPGQHVGLADLDRLYEDVRRGGVNVSSATEGQSRLLSAAEEQTAYRVVQEALTNVLRHAPGAEVCVRLNFSPDLLAIDVTNEAATVKGGSTGSDDRGLGIKGMRERLLLLGGELTAGPTEDGGFRVSARLPLS